LDELLLLRGTLGSKKNETVKDIQPSPEDFKEKSQELETFDVVSEVAQGPKETHTESHDTVEEKLDIATSSQEATLVSVVEEPNLSIEEDANQVEEESWKPVTGSSDERIQVKPSQTTIIGSV